MIYKSVKLFTKGLQMVYEWITNNLYMDTWCTNGFQMLKWFAKGLTIVCK